MLESFLTLGGTNAAIVVFSPSDKQFAYAPISLG
jgi:hypothetical protein